MNGNGQSNGNGDAARGHDQGNGHAEGDGEVASALTVGRASAGSEAIASEVVDRESLVRESIGHETIARDPIAREAANREAPNREPLVRESIGHEPIARDAIAREAPNREPIMREVPLPEPLPLRAVEPLGRGVDVGVTTPVAVEPVDAAREALLRKPLVEPTPPSASDTDLAVLLAPRVGLYLMPRLDTLDAEHWSKRSLYIVLMLGLLCGYFYMLMSFWAPAHSGINQNGYLVAGKMLAEHGTVGYKPREPYAYLGWMWNLVKVGSGASEEIWYYPKYPMGTSALFAACLKASQWINGNWEAGKIWSFYVNPVTMTLSLAAMFMLLRIVAGSFLALLGTMILACSQVVLSYANQPLSHGPAMCAVTWGMYFLLTWWMKGSIWRGVCAGLLLGYAVTTRYTEGLLVVPIGAAVLSMISYDRASIRWWSLGTWLIAAVVGLWIAHGTSVPVDRWYTIGVAGVLTAAVGLVPVLRGQLQRSASPQAVRRRAWAPHVLHWVRAVVAAALLLAIVRTAPIRIDGADDGANLIVTIVFKLCIAIALAMLYLIPWSQPRRYLGVAVPVVAWLIPVGFLLAYNKLAMHSMTGYDTTNESTAFTWRTFLDKWDDTVQQLYDYSMFLIPPLALAGLVLMYRWSWRVALFVTLWLIPPMLVYIAYYFGKQRPGMWYLRFFLTLFPPMLMAAMWLLRAAADGVRQRAATLATSVGQSDRARSGWVRARGSVAVPLGLGIFTACSCAVGLWLTLPSMEREFYTNYNLAFTTARINRKIPAIEINGKPDLPVLFTEGQANPNGPLCNMIQFSADTELYASDGFKARGIGWRGDVDPNAPNPLQAARQDYMINLLRNKTDAQMIAEQNRIMRKALDEGRPVFAVLQKSTVAAFRRYITADFQMEMIDSWQEPMKVTAERSMGPLDSSSRGMPFYPTRPAQSWQMYEVKFKKPAPPAPAPAPAATSAPTTSVPTTSPTTIPAGVPAGTQPAGNSGGPGA